MSLGVLNNITAIYAQNNLNQSQSSLQKVLTQLSSGSRINSGADDAAGLSLANGLQASATALSQSAKNASEGVDFLQVADGALSQVTSLLNRAVTLATEASNGTLNGSQTNAADSEYQKILTEINTINSTTQYNGINTFAATSYAAAGASDAVDFGAADSVTMTYSDGTTATLNTALTTKTLSGLASAINTQAATDGQSLSASVKNGELVVSGGSISGTITDTVLAGGSAGVTSINVSDANDSLAIGGVAADKMTITYTDNAGAKQTATLSGGTTYSSLSNLAQAINTATGMTTATVSGNKMSLTGASISNAAAASLNETGNVSATNNQSVAIFTSDGTVSQSYNNTSADIVTTDSAALKLAATSLSSSTSAQAALSAINAAITAVAANRGTVGANINTLTAVGNVMTTQSTNTLAAQNDVTATDYGQATSDMSKYQILSQTGVAALAQANQSQQLITKLLQ